MGDLLSLDEEDIEQYVGSPGHYTPDPSSEAAPFEYSGEFKATLQLHTLLATLWLVKLISYVRV